MLRISVGIVTVFSSIACSAQSVEVMERCEGYAAVAKSIMTERQADRPMSELMRSAADMQANADLTKRLVIEAYKLPSYRTQTHRDRVVSEFENSTYLECITALKGK